ncbi:flagellar assembly peptidoglycan hydrolase FlgJ [Hahella aquimaris]|uniref:flagellar assembly peptidoglycan hydrolase FlgJ n=1 Tax=Hahella sp. HNIBRBA332 TaxID=3015983 RepID=UPI00273AF73E|nr:flagellar assembly peptidoglycan hydrolase FlgJ [Hahella sp. HNIBRBA332]WLQ17303.1 flagellar assembly peptidoglycan hydrolase FlgJ [Hahella sp. HNIBRBA332]
MTINNRALDQAHVYTDLNALQRLKSPSMDKSEAISAVSKQFESIMVNLMLKSMRQVNAVFEQGNPFHDSASNVYQDMFDHQLSLTLSKHKSFGLADALTKQLLARESGEPKKGGYKDITEYPRSLEAMTLSYAQAEESLAQAPELTEEEIQALEQVAYYSEQMSRSAFVDSDVKEAVAAAEASQATVGEGEEVQKQTAPVAFESPQHFVNSLLASARKASAGLGVEPGVLLAQSALETGWGRRMILTEEGEPSYNLFGIKADQRWKGPVAWVTTTEYREGSMVKERAPFRVYGSYEESFTDYLNFLQGQPRYQQALKQVAEPEEYLRELQKAGYATDPNYASKIQRIMNGAYLQSVRSDDQG